MKAEWQVMNKLQYKVGILCEYSNNCGLREIFPVDNFTRICKGKHFYEIQQNSVKYDVEFLTSRPEWFLGIEVDDSNNVEYKGKYLEEFKCQGH